jgi:hypothetical protein
VSAYWWQTSRIDSPAALAAVTLTAMWLDSDWCVRLTSQNVININGMRGARSTAARHTFDRTRHPLQMKIHR